ncbi:MAG TPA: metallophosphoesterase family protein [bacterium]|nr:metallophosphoesterase family protein [bacterium]
MIYAIGDIHGCLKQLQDLLAQLPLGPDDELVFLGDYIDRGPDSKGVLDYLLKERQPHWHFLRGNHEQMLLDWLGTPNPLAASNWLLNGGHQTLQSYIPKDKMDEVRGEGIHVLLQSYIPHTHVEFLNALPLTYDTPEAFFCHAGINLDKPLADQEADDLLWIRRKFLQDPRPTPKLVVHGHTPVEKLDLTRDRINLDTGCVYGGALTALALPERKAYQAK